MRIVWLSKKVANINRRMEVFHLFYLQGRLFYNWTSSLLTACFLSSATMLKMMLLLNSSNLYEGIQTDTER